MCGDLPERHSLPRVAAGSDFTGQACTVVGQNGYFSKSDLIEKI
jgi:hypothetical protein